MEHTPGPFEVRKFNDTKSTSIYADGVNHSIASVKTPADAAFIVHACNCHDELLAACKRALSFLHIDVPLGTGNDHELMQCQIALQSAIAKAEGKT
jgi:hypothetical protein